MTAPPTLYWNVLKWNFDVERVVVILGHNVDYTGSMSRMSILVLEGSKGSHLEGGRHAKQNRNLAFSGGKSGWNWLKIWTGIHSPDPPAPCKNPVSGLRGCYVPWSSKKRATGWHFDLHFRKNEGGGSKEGWLNWPRSPSLCFCVSLDLPNPPPRGCYSMSSRKNWLDQFHTEGDFPISISGMRWFCQPWRKRILTDQKSRFSTMWDQRSIQEIP